MKFAEARQVLLLRAVEDPPVAPWSAADRDAVSREADAACGSDATPEQRIVARAALAAPRLVAREPQAATALALTDAPAWALPLAGLAAFGSGLVMDALGASRHINLFALPLLGLLAWNLAVYALLLVAALRSPQTGSRPGWLASAIGSMLQRLRSGRRLAPALRRYAADWTALVAPVQLQRLNALLHAGAALLALGVVAGMYARGGFLEFRAGWESTFFDATTLHRFVGWLLGPAAWLSGLALPTVQEFEALRLAGGGGPAARWIHLYAITLGLVIVLPRLLLAGLAAASAQRLARALPLALDAPYFRALLRRHGGPAQAVRLLPYSYQVAPEALAGVQQALEAALGGDVALQVLPVLPMGGEDSFDVAQRILQADAQPQASLALLFAATATPERETHGAAIALLAQRLRGTPQRLLVVVDLSGFRRRFTGPDAATRIAQRRAAWEALGREVGAAIVFADTAAPQAGAS